MPLDKLSSLLSLPATGFLLKLIAGVATAGFGLLGIGTTTRDSNGKLTRSGWIAFSGIVIGGILAVGSSIYDFVSAQETDRQTRLRSEQLLTSVRRGIFPMRSLKVSGELLMNGNIVAVTAFKATVRNLASSDRKCEKVPKIFECNGFGLDLPQLYEIGVNSPLFPKEGSDLRRLITNTIIHVAILKELSFDDRGSSEKGQQREVQYLGRFFISWRQQGLPSYTRITYDYGADTITLHFEDVPIRDTEVMTAGVYSLVDFLPGYIRLMPSLGEDPMCDGQPNTGICQTSQILEFSKGLVLSSFEFSFPYPKMVRGDASTVTSCVAEPGNGISTGLAVELPVDIEGLDSLGNIVSPLQLPPTKKSICELTDPKNVLPSPSRGSLATVHAL